MEGTVYKFAIVLNRKVEPARLLNACAHLAAAITNEAGDQVRGRMGFIDYVDKDGAKHPVSKNSLIILAANNSSQLSLARGKAIEAGLLTVDFVESMTGGAYVEQLERTALLRESELEYWGVAVFGEKGAVEAVTKKFSLWR